jgi:mRNA-degrading endonuclease toxin of MazEF toxin-antitoxin module
MKKDYINWTPVKAKVNNAPKRPTYKEGEVFWVSIGENVGFEQDGKGRLFARPVLVVRKFNRDFFIGIPLTSKPKDSRYYYNFSLNGKVSTAILSQIRAFDAARISGSRMGKVSDKTLETARDKIKELL